MVIKISFIKKYIYNIALNKRFTNCPLLINQHFRWPLVSVLAKAVWNTFLWDLNTGNFEKYHSFRNIIGLTVLWLNLKFLFLRVSELQPKCRGRRGVRTRLPSLPKIFWKNIFLKIWIKQEMLGVLTVTVMFLKNTNSEEKWRHWSTDFAGVFCFMNLLIYFRQ